jgi:hypothetical protein
VNKSLFLVILLTFSLSVFPKTRKLVAEVVLMRGKVTQLAPGERLARKLKVGDKVREDTSILTGAKSFVQLKYEDGSKTSLGPDSKIVVAKMDKSGNGVLNLLKGRVRNSVKQDYEGKKKFYVRTRNAALGVRGTEFETIYNSDNNLTSLLTYKGEVAMVKTEDSIDKSKTNLKSAKRVVRNFDNKIVLEEEPELVEVDEKKMEKLLEKEAVVVKQGQFSQTVAKIETVSKPVVISPVQMNAMYKNQTFQEKGVKEVQVAEVDPTKAKLAIVPEKQDIPPEGIYDPKNKVYAPKAGGFLDVKTGLYVPPSPEALFDQKNKVYYASNVGAVDSETGQYEPPVGLELDPVKGFVEKKFTPDAPQQLIAEVKAKKEKLNSALAVDVVQAKGKSETTTETGSVRPLSNRELISKNIFSISYMPFSQTYDHEGDTYLGTTRNFEADSNFDVKLSIDYASGSRWQPVTSYTLRNVEFPSSQRGSFDQQGKKLTELSVGVRYSMSPRWSSTFEAKLDQQYFLHHSGSTTTTSQFTRITIPKLQLGFKGTVFHVGRLFAELGGYFGSNLPKSSGDQKLGIGLNYGFNAELKYWIFQQAILGVGLFNDFESISVEGSTRVYEADTNRSSSALRMTLSTFF